jgi:hypothetical protein
VGARLLVVLVATLCVAAGAPALAHAAALGTTITSTQSSPVAGEAVKFTAHPSGGSQSPSYHYQWNVDGTNVASGNPPSTLTRAFAAGTHTVKVTVSDSNCSCEPAQAQNQTTFTVYPVLSGSISASPDPAKAGQPVTLTATTAGGKPPRSVAWDTDGNGFNDGTGSTIRPTFHTQGQRVVRALVRDAASPAHALVLTKNLTVGVPASCHQQLDFGLSEITTSGCLTRVRTHPDRYETTAAVQLNGIAFPAPARGHKTVVTLPHRGAPGGSIALFGTSISFHGLTVFRGNVAWNLPAGKKGEEKALRTLTVPASQELLGFKVGGTVAVRLGWRSNGTHYAAFPLSIELPEVFKAGPDRGSGGVSGTGSVRVDRGGVHLEGLKIQVNHAYVGKIKVESACFSYAAKGSQSVEPCSGPSVGGSPYITCSNSANTERFDGSAVLELPTGSHPRLGAFGGIADSRLSKLGGFANHLGTSVPLASGVFLDRVGVGLCVYPPPFKLKGDVGVNVLPVGGKPTVNIDGYFLYTDGFNSVPWSLELGGSVDVFDTTIGKGKVILRPTGSIDFSANADFNLLHVASVSGSIVGWIEIPKRTFDIEGRVQGCLRTLCADTDAVVSSTGVAGCVRAGSISYPTIVKDSDWAIYAPWRVHTTYDTVNLQAGFGYRWHDTSISLLGTACDMTSYHAVRSKTASAAAAGAGRDFLVPAHTQALALRVRGSSGPPKLVVTGPGGQQFRSSDSGPAARRSGHWMIVENPTDGTTSVLLVRPSRGRWNVQSLDAAKPITGLETAGFRAPPSFAASVARGRHNSRVLSLAYGVSSDERIAVIERGRQVLHTLTRKLAARRCPRGPSRAAGRRLLCARIAFQPSFGPGGRRKVQAVITRSGQPVKTVTLATFHVASPARPRRQRSVRMARRHGGVVLAWTGAAFARTHSISVKLGSGREFGVTSPANCRAVFLRGIPRGVGVRIRIVGVRRDLIAGPATRLLLKAGRSRSGSRAKLPRRICSS